MLVMGILKSMQINNNIGYVKPLDALSIDLRSATSKLKRDFYVS